MYEWMRVKILAHKHRILLAPWYIDTLTGRTEELTNDAMIRKIISALCV